MISKLALSFSGVMIAIALCVSSTSAQDAQDNSQRPDRREATGANRPQRLGGEPRKQINPRQREAIRKMRERTENGPVPAGLERRKIQVGKEEREYFINIPQSCRDKPSPVVFVLHGGATSSGIAMHLKTDFTKLGASAGYITVYPSGMNGWNIGSHDMYSVQRRTSNADDVGFFRTMFDELIEKKMPIPPGFIWWVEAMAG
jgi:poly(3-hydroxybutyrate) depolymerase